MLVATVRALKMHGGQRKSELGSENLEALRAGCANLARHVRNIGQFGVPVVVAINRFDADTDAEIALLKEQAARLGCEAVEATHFRDGGAGAEALARAVQRLADSGHSQFRTLYDDEMPLWDKVCCVARTIYGAGKVVADQKVLRQVPAVRRHRRQLPGLHCEDPVQLLHRSGPARRAHGPRRCRCATWCSPTAPSSRWCCAATS